MPQEASKEWLEKGEWSEIICVQTLDNQVIDGEVIDDVNVKKYQQENNELENSMVSSYSLATINQLKVQKVDEFFQFLRPSFIYGKQEWTFGKHYFQIEAQLQAKDEDEYPDLNCYGNLPKGSFTSNQCHLTVGLLCTVAVPKAKIDAKKTPRIENKRQSKQVEEDEEKVIIGCKISLKDTATVQVYLNIEKGLLFCIANGKAQEKFDLSMYSSCIPLVKYDGDAHNHFKVLV
mmetsp:Transcript_21252/g.20401  ORF Transcript_21252/g.20401 Transcript_21252/m.20401 type:complete len:233 (+) Transcript_21252:2221-2919(+)|eukprot:CAMPEP_0170545486 /NCGR_PEP_ID=MMETSP0211-20121228/3875_1 /TAXON_ID=311385 /ORGANISM="Pseudokeronopsis sp., Strain OXSARD2" /LENGTH=232 /DNA_ID=CAMNT_0010849423 /DNA_START=2146 /DNA_END=2844 /DNA_ORIENTATION=+